MRLLVAAGAAGLLVHLLMGIARAQRRPTGRTSGAAALALSTTALIIVGVLFLSASVVLWRPLPVTLSARIQQILELTGGLVALAGIGLTWWGRMTLGALYDVSSSVAARLRDDHRLVTTGPFAIVRHPMYVGIGVASLGSILLYRTWTTVFFTVAFSGLSRRARREDSLLEAEFGDEWRSYASQVPAWLPRLSMSRSRDR